MKHAPLPIPKELQELYDWVRNSEYGPFNQMMINWYQHGQHFIRAHRDDEKPLVPNSPILSISIAATRTFRIRDYSTKKIVKDILMPNGTVLVMGGKFNTQFTHEVPKIGGEKGKTIGRKINITFRRFKDDLNLKE